MPAEGGRPPSVDALARSLVDTGLPHPLLVDAARAAIARGDPDAARAEAEAVAAALLRPVVNATGVLLHTNLGRAPVAHDQAATYTNLELDLTTGERGSRGAHAAGLLARACGADAATVVNNGAAAVLLALAALARDREVVVSRGELVEIGGGFRIPEILATSGARLVEVGTTNRTRREDYEQAVTADTALLLKVHQSNYRITGFTEAVAVAALADLGPTVAVDLGSGLLDAGCPWLTDGPPAWLRGEPGVRQTLAAGAGVVTFSGDKLLGGPQAGIIAGRAELVAACARHPLARALRPGGLVLGALQATALAYLDRRGDDIPLWRMVARSVDDLRARAEAIGIGTVIDTVTVAGGGTLPGTEIESVGIAVDGDQRRGLRRAAVPVIARVADGRTVLDLRTVEPDQDAVVAAALAGLPGGG
ncbi:MAG TPA: L-seryl-tRNA(Sec) selenium transferase [Acidimicrobiales bacterium]